ncbi:hypothetical protein BCR36DRAFT_359993 [Piromyces finnis]|uniref:Man1/Src1-like C-terminal domain-containing protein n=1 Tax=Piromyces finnis TaxID=1754191 RepID=A0A1Y1UZQ8_9FUNG|nr:hypothetical protein BCR36DRAFT_359993 [Piromyces finnis]|eukprot:ORX44121.1 hypothetical protein BCR36DRAFT_359993 [Piromyces finnis]
MSGAIPDYLKKNFDPNSLTIPQLRSILKDHDIENVPAPNQPKRVFIKLFNNVITENRETILKKLNISEQEKKKPGRPRKSDINVNSESLNLPNAVRGKSESPAKEIKNKRVSFGMNEIKIKYEESPKKTKEKTSEIVKEDSKEKKPLIQNTINKLNEEHELNSTYEKSYSKEQSGIQTGNVKRARQKFNEDNNQSVEIKKTKVDDDEEPSPKKRKHDEKASKKSPINSNTSNIFQKFDSRNNSMEITSPPSFTSSSSKIPNANIVFAEENDDEEDGDYVYQSNSPSISVSEEDDVINDEEMADLERDSIDSSNINFSEGSYQEQSVPISTSDSSISVPPLDNINYVQAMNENSPLNKVSKSEKPKSSLNGSSSFSYEKVNNSFSRSNRLEKPQSQSFSYNKSNNSFTNSNRLGKPYSYSFSYNKSNTSFSKSKKAENSDYSPLNTSFNDKPKINISYDMSPIQSSHDTILYDDALLNQGSYDKSSSNVIGNLYDNEISEENENEAVEVIPNECKRCSLVNILAGLFGFLMVLSIGLFCEWHIHTGGFNGFCNLEKLTRSEMTYLDKLPENSILRYSPFYHYLPKCLNCPKNAICNENEGRVIACKKNTDKLQSRLISNFIPNKYLIFPLNQPVCGFDFEKKRNYDRLLQNVNSLMKISIDIIKKQLGEIECQKDMEIVDGKKVQPKTQQSGISESILHSLLKEEIGNQIRKERFESLWNFMVAKLKMYDYEALKKLCEGSRRKWKTTEIKDDSFFCDTFSLIKYIPEKGNVIQVENDNAQYPIHEGLFVTSEKPVHSLKCRFKWFMERYICNNVQNIIERYWMYGLGIIILTNIAGIITFIVKRKTRRNNIINSICEEVIWLLQESEYQHKEDPLHFPSPNVSVAQLYDILLPVIISVKDKDVPEGDCVEIINDDGSTTHYWVFHNSKERALIWKKVYEKVRANSNVLESNALVKRESHRCWEWIGNPALNNRRKSPNTINKQVTTYYPKVANNSRLSLGGSSSRSFISQQFAGDISAISNVEGNSNESYMTFNEDGKEADTSSIKDQISKISIFNKSQIIEKEEGNELNETSRASIKRRKSGASLLYPTI